MKEIDKKIAKVLMNVGRLEGVNATHNDEVAFEAGHLDDYLLVGYLGQLLEHGEIEICINNPDRMDFVYQLLKMNPEHSFSSKYITVEEVAQIFKMSTQTVYNMLRDGRLTGHKIGRRWLFDKEEITKLSKKNRSESNDK